MAYDYLKSYISLILVFYLADFYTAIKLRLQYYSFALFDFLTVVLFLWSYSENMIFMWFSDHKVLMKLYIHVA